MNVSEVTKGAYTKLAADSTKKASAQVEKEKQGAISQVSELVVKQLANSPEAQYALETLNEALEIYSKLHAGVPSETLKLINETIDPQKRSDLISQALSQSRKTIADNQAAALVSLRNQHYNNISSEVDHKARVLESLRENIQKVKSSTDQELANLRAHAGENKELIQNQIEEHQERTFGDHEMRMDEINHTFKLKEREITGQSKLELEALNDKFQSDVTKQKVSHEKEVLTREEKNSQEIRNSALKHTLLKDQMEEESKNNTMRSYKTQEEELAKINKLFGTQQELLRADVNGRRKQQDRFFEKRYAEAMKGHQETIGRLEERQQKIVNDAKAQHTVDLNSRKSQNDDPFFEFTEINPTIKDLGDSIEVSLTIPEYARKDLMLTFNDKEIILTTNRSFDDVYNHQTGQKKVHRVESLTNRVFTGHSLDAKSVQSSYDNGMITYKIQKASLAKPTFS